MDGIPAVFRALGLPAGAQVDMRVPKKLLAEQIAATPADKRLIQDGIDELQWLATCRPSTVGVPAYRDEIREYLEIAVVACAFRPKAKSTRLIELIHRGIPYPVLLIASDDAGLTVSVAHKRHAQNEAGKVVAEVIVTAALGRSNDKQILAFFERIPLAMQPRRDLFSLYEGWVACLEALNAALVSGSFGILTDEAAIQHRRSALEAHVRLTREIVALRAQANREKQLNRRIELNLQLQRLNAELAAETKKL